MAVQWVPRPGAPNTVLSVSRISQLPPDRTAQIAIKVRSNVASPTQGVLLRTPLAQALGHPKESVLPFRQVVELVWAYVKEYRLHEPERRNHPRGSTLALKAQSPSSGYWPRWSGAGVAPHTGVDAAYQSARGSRRGPQSQHHQFTHRLDGKPTAYELQYYDTEPLCKMS